MSAYCKVCPAAAGVIPGLSFQLFGTSITISLKYALFLVAVCKVVDALVNASYKEIIKQWQGW